MAKVDLVSSRGRITIQFGYYLIITASNYRLNDIHFLADSYPCEEYFDAEFKQRFGLMQGAESIGKLADGKSPFLSRLGRQCETRVCLTGFKSLEKVFYSDSF